MVREVVAKMGFVDCVVYFVDPEKGLLRQQAAIGPQKNPVSKEIVNALEIPIGKGITGHVAATKEPLIIDDLEKDDRYVPDIEKARSEICVPLMIGNQTVGVIDCEDPRVGFFNDYHLEILSTIAALASAKLKLFEQTETVEVVKQLYESESKFRDFAKAASDWFWETDTQHRIIWESVRSQIETPVAFDKIKGMARWDIAGPVANDAAFWAPLRKIMDDHEVFRDFEYPHFSETGEVAYVRVSGVPVFDENSQFTGYRGMSRNITTQKQQELDLRESREKFQIAKEEAEIANRSKSEFLANMSHELRTPLNAIIGFSDSIRNEVYGPLENDRYKEYLSDIHKSGSLLLELINDILDVSAIEAGMLKLFEDKIDFREAAQASLRLVSNRAEMGNIHLITRIDEDVPMIFADERRVQQILINLLTNAIKFTPPDGQVSLQAGVDETGEFLIAVSDTGIGMSKEELTEAMSEFGQVESALSRRHEGTGLGIPFTQGLVHLHSGTLTFDSQKGQGTTVTVKLPKERVMSSP